MKIFSNDDIVITGMDGRFPKSKNMDELGRNLYNKIDMSSDEIRWSPSDYPDIPKRTYYIDYLEKFDAELFKIHPKQVEVLDPQVRILLETAYSAILDSGVHPAALKGSNTGVFVANTNHEMMTKVHNEPADTYTITGAHPSLLSNRISHALDLKGPSFTLDTACSSSMYATFCAVNSLRLKQCDAALVCGTNLLLNTNLTAHLMKMGVLSPDGICWSYDNRGNGFIRAESIAVMFLQRRGDAKRIYAEIVHVSASNDGHKAIGLISPCGESQCELFSKFYREIQIDPLYVKYVESHATATIAGDREECFGIEKTFCNSRRMEPLLVGAVKPNMGHSEATSALCSIAKVIHAFQTGLIPATIHVQNLRKDIPSLTEGHLKVCTETTPLPGKLVAVNSFGFGGTNCHLLLRQFNKEKEENRNSYPSLVVWSGRTKEAVAIVMAKVKSMPLNREFVGLLHEVQKIHVPKNHYRGFGIFEETLLGETPSCLTEETCHAVEDNRRSIVWLFSGEGCQWIGMGKSLMTHIRPFYNSLLKCHNVMLKYSVDLISIITTGDALDDPSNSLLGVTAIQLALVDLLRLLGVPLDYTIGHSSGELLCAYVDGTITLTEALLSSYLRGKASTEENSIDSLSSDRLQLNIQQLRLDKVFVNEVNSSSQTDEYLPTVGAKYMNYLQKVMQNRVLRSSKWISSSIPYNEWHSDLSKFNSAEYHVNNLLSPVLFEEACSYLPQDAIVIEIAPHGLMQSIMKRLLPDAINVPLMERDNPKNVAFFLAAIGRLYNHGVNVQIAQLYPEVEYPVARGTPMIAPLIKYDHQHDWNVPKFNLSRKDSMERKITIDVSQEQYQYLFGHTVDGNLLHNAWISVHFLVWETMVSFSSQTDLNTFNVEFTNIEYHRTVTLNTNYPVQLLIVIQASGKFEVIEGETAVATGMVKHCTHDASTSLSDLTINGNGDDSIVLSKSDIYKELQLRGYRLSGGYQGLESFCWDNKTAKIKWNDNWEQFIDAMTHVYLMSRDTRTSHLGKGFEKVKIDAVKHCRWLAGLANKNGEDTICDAFYCQETNTIVAGGIEISGIKMKALDRRAPNDTELLEIYQFVPLVDECNLYNVADAVQICVQLHVEKLLETQLSVIEYLNKNLEESLIEHFRDVVRTTPRVSGTFKLVTNQDYQLDSIEVVPTMLDDHSKNSIVVWNADKDDDIGRVLENVRTRGFLIVVHYNKHVPTKLKPRKDFTLTSFIQCSDFNLSIFQNETMPIPVDKIISINSNDHQFSWLKEVQRAHTDDNVLLLSERDSTSGVLGFLKSIRYETNVPNCRCVIIEDDNAPPFNIEHPFYSSQMRLNLPVNVVRNGKWGTLRQLTLSRNDIDVKPSNSLCVAKADCRESLESLVWVPGQDIDATSEYILVKFVGLNMQDVMVASGVLSQNVFVSDSVDQDGCFGREYSGIDVNGRNVMGTTFNGGALVTRIVSDSNDFTFYVPDSMSLEEASSIPLDYLNAYAAFFSETETISGQKILVHNGQCHSALAAIRTAITYNLDVHTTVSSLTNKLFLMEQLPELKESNIHIRSSPFNEDGVVVNTVFSYIPEDEMDASIRYLKDGGTLVLFEPFNTTKVAESAKILLDKGISLKIVSLAKIARHSSSKKLLIEAVTADLKRGVIKPLPTKVFDLNQVKDAFAAVASEKWNEKVVITMPSQSDMAKLIVKAKFVPCSKSVYIITGGLGGVGLELANWLIMRGVKTLILSSRYGPEQAYQQYRLRFWKSVGCNIVISTRDITSVEGCEQLLRDSNAYGQVAEIFCLACGIFDQTLSNQTSDLFKRCFAPKVNSVQHLDKLSRTLCPMLNQFVVFSSVASSRSNAGQSNYAMANAIVDRIVENRVQDGFPGKSIQWGPISDVGLVARITNNESNTPYAGLKQQRVDRCLQALDNLLFAKHPIVSSIQVANTSTIVHSNVFAKVVKTFGVRDADNIQLNVTLGDFGIDSLIASEISEILERETGVSISSDDLKYVTIEELKNVCNRS